MNNDTIAGGGANIYKYINICQKLQLGPLKGSARHHANGQFDFFCMGPTSNKLLTWMDIGHD